MKINSISINGKKFQFSKQSTLIYSTVNGTGKTTLLRLLLYGLGYPIPATKGIDFSSLSIKVSLTKDNGEQLTLDRSDKIITISQNSTSSTEFHVIENALEIQSIIFDITDPKILENLLGLYYFDQEKGWTLLNRGIVIGSIRFKIESFVEGLSSRELFNLDTSIEDLTDQKREYRQFRRILSIKDKSASNSQSINWSPIDQINNKLRSLETEIRRYKSVEAQYRSINLNNENLFKFIEGLNLKLRTSDGVIPIKRKNIVERNVNRSLLNAQITRQKRKILQLSEERERLQKELSQSLLGISVDSQLKRFNIAISSLDITTEDLDKIDKQYVDKIKKLKQKRIKILNNSQIAENLYGRILKFCNHLNVGKSIDPESSFLWTSNLRRYSGAQLHLIVFAYRMALLQEVQEHFSVIIPIILDSPMTGELDKENASLMFSLIHKYFPKNQIIVASIFRLPLNDDDLMPLNTITLTKGSIVS